MEKEIGKTALITSKVEELAAEIKAAGSQAISPMAELENAKDVEPLFQRTADAFDKMDVVVDAAGIMPLFPIANANPEEFDRVIAANLRGMLRSVHCLASHQGGRQFPMTYARLGTTLFYRSEMKRAAENMRKAYELRHTVSERERF